MLRNLVYSKLEPKLNDVAKFFAEKKITPNQLSLAGLAMNALAGLAYSGGAISFAGLLVLVGSFGDLLDGPLARLTGKTSKFGAFLDSTVDRYSDFFLFGGLSFYFARQESWGWFLTCLGILVGAFLTSYTKARAESLIPACRVGIIERAERIILLIVGSLLPKLLPWALFLLLIGTNATAIQRILFVQKILHDKEENRESKKESA